MNHDEVVNIYKKLLDDIDFEKLEIGLRVPNIFQILRVSRTEIRHSNFLGWLLDPNESHGLGGSFLIKFLREVTTSSLSTSLNVLDINNLNFSNVQIRREWKSIDLLIIFDDLVVCIENKVDSREHSSQLKRYRAIIDNHFAKHRKVFVYLTPTGDAPSIEEDRLYYINYSYEDIVNPLNQILEIHKNSLSERVFHYISDYVNTLEREIMQNNELNILANKIYSNHKELLDFIYLHKTDEFSIIGSSFENKVKDTNWVLGSSSKSYVRFLTPKLQSIIPNDGSGWKNKESFLFEIVFDPERKKANFKTVISPGNVKVVEILEKALRNVEGSSSPRGGKWLVHFNHAWKFDARKFADENEAEIQHEINKEWGKIESIVSKVEAEILKYEDKLIPLKNSDSTNI